jgi:hypothetical protein
VIDAGRYDGTLGVVAGILAVGHIARQGKVLPFDVGPNIALSLLFLGFALATG